MGAGLSTEVVYEDFSPPHKVVREEGIDTLIVELPEFNKEQIRVLLENFENLSIIGERPLADNRRSRFGKYFRVEGCDGIGSKFENGRLNVSMFPSAKAAIKITDTKAKDQPIQTQQPKAMQPSAGTRKDAEVAGEKGKDPTEEKKGKEKLQVLGSGLGFSKPMHLLFNVIVAVVVLVVMALYVTSKN